MYLLHEVSAFEHFGPCVGRQHYGLVGSKKRILEQENDELVVVVTVDIAEVVGGDDFVVVGSAVGDY